MKATTLLSTIGLAAFLAACGGGGDDAQASDAYVGTWKGDCKESELVAESAPDVYLKEVVTFKFTKVTDTKLSMVTTQDFYPAAGCSGTPLVSHTNTSDVNAMSIDGTTTVAGGSAAHKVTVVEGSLGAGISAGATINLNGVIYPGDFFVDSGEYKALAQVTGNTLHFGGDEPLDEQGYPTTVNRDYKFIKQ